MGNAARKARKRAGVPFYKAPKRPTYPRWTDSPHGLGLTTGPEILAALVTRALV
ncbi:hypothetical protein [Microbacterium sp. 77mftsu3.1]|uniref:hypothetical protein n=1 Tax=Microbacterium sp. 77mftsu3.1 TaxID=1761802 RepID=UPI00037515A9|nr:hypothetical protein [Microbacterium sp. 77mftsu3.1]SDG22212.1 hypothetical protein SAMN04488590_0230 [Microbacterium sp. 77mftsu3.1]